MQNWDYRYDSFPVNMREYLHKAENRVVELIENRPWIRAGLERQVWKDTGVYPTLVGETIKTLYNFGYCWVGKYKKGALSIVKKYKGQKIPTYFEEQHKRLDQHLSNTAVHSDVLEVLVNLSLYHIRKINEYTVLIIPDATISGQQFDTYFSYKGEGIGIEARNKTGDTSESDTNDFVYKCYGCVVRPMIISTWMSSGAQTTLANVHGFFSNLCRIYTIEDYPEIRDDFNQNGFDNLVSFLDFTNWGWKNATEAKKWINTKENLKKHDEICDKAETVFLGLYENKALNHLLQKIKGILIYSLLSIHIDNILRTEKDLRRLGSKPFTEKQKQQLQFIPTVYLNMLFHVGEKRALSIITNDMSQASYIKKQNKNTRSLFIKYILNFLEDFKAITRQNESWVINDAKSPYIEENAIF